MEIERNNSKQMDILIVDDEIDVLDVLAELLAEQNTVRATTFNEGKKLLENQSFDLAILDIMGVDGFRLLDIANERKVMAIILTAHALTLENTVKAYKKGASFFLPKEEMANIDAVIKELIEIKSKGEGTWALWLERLESFYDKKFGPNWKDDEREFWEKLSEYRWRLASVLRKRDKSE